MQFRRRRRVSGPSKPAVDGLESRVLFSLALVAPLADLTVQSGSSAARVNLTDSFDDAAVPTRVRFDTVLGNLDLEMLDGVKPVTIANFLKYVKAGRYDNTIVHRATNPAADGLGVIQGGGYSFPDFGHIPTDAPIANEFETNGVRSNVRGTVAMAKTSNPDSATSEFFVNTSDNAQALDDPRNSGGFTVFAQVINNTLATADAIAALPTRAFAAPFGQIPLRDYSDADFAARKTPTADNVVLVRSAFVMPDGTFTVDSSDPSIATATVNNGVLLVTPQAGKEGKVTFTVTATDGATTVQDAFDVTVVPGIDVQIGDGQAKALTFTDADGTVGTVTVKGGTATVRLNGSGLTQAADPKKGTTVSGTNLNVERITIANASAGGATVTFKAKGGDGRLSVGAITTDGTIKSLAGKQIAITNGLTATGGLGKVAVGGDLRGGVSAPSLASAAVGGAVGGGTWDVSGNAGKLAFGSAATDWVGNFGGDVASITVANDLAGALTARSIKSLTVKGGVQDTNINLTQPFAAGAVALGKLTAGRAIDNTQIHVASNLGTITAAAITNSTIFAGLDVPEGGALPDAASDFTSQATIKGISAKGKGAQATFADTNIAAASLGKVALGTIQTNNAAVPFGIAADKIASLTGVAGATPIKLSKLDDPAAAATQIAALQGLQDFLIRVV